MSIRLVKPTGFNIHYNNDGDKKLLQEVFNEVGAKNVHFMGRDRGPANFDLETADQMSQLLDKLLRRDFHDRDFRIYPRRVGLFSQS